MIYFVSVFVFTGGGEKCRSRNNSFGLPEKKVYPDFEVAVRGRGQWDSPSGQHIIFVTGRQAVKCGGSSSGLGFWTPVF